MRKTEKLGTAVRREQIAEAALVVAADTGLGGITVKRVAQRVGLTPSGLYRHYRSKGEIIDAVLAWVHDRFQDNISAAEADSDHALDVLRDILVRNLRTIHRYSLLPLFFLSGTIWQEEPRIAARVRANMGGTLARIAGILARGQRAGQVRSDADPECMAVSFIGAYGMPAMLHAREVVETDLELLVETNWKLLRGALAPQHGA